MRVSVNLSDEEVKILSKRAKKNLLSLQEQVEDIVRRSCVLFSKGPAYQPKLDDGLVEIFSRERKGNNGNKKKNKSEKKEPFYTSALSK